MNKESSIKQLERIKQDMTHADDVNALDFAIRYMKNKTLEQIRAEIESASHGKWYVGRIDGKTEEVLLLDVVLQIIDKYREG
jgi:hypothetical protein